MSRSRGVRLAVAAAAWSIVIGYCTLRSAPASAYRVAETSWHCLVCGAGGATDTFLNLLLFAPLGAVAAAAGWRLRRIVPLVCCCSTAIEIYQANILVGRDGTLGDVLSNTLGGAIGWLALPLIIALARPTPRLAWRAAWTTLLLSTLIWLGTGIGLRPALTGPAPWWGQRLHLWPGHDPFPGSLQRTTLNGIDIPNDPLDSLPAPRDTLSLSVGATRTSDRVPVRPVSVLRVIDADHHVLAGVAQNGNALTVEVQVRASRLWIRTPEWRVAGTFAIPVGEPWRFDWRWLHDRVELDGGPAAGPERQIAAQPLSVALGWVFVHPFVDTLDGSAPWWTALWLAWWFGALAWFGSAAGMRTAAGFGIAGVAVLAGSAMLTATALQWYEGFAAAASYAAVAMAATAWRRAHHRRP